MHAYRAYEELAGPHLPGSHLVGGFSGLADALASEGAPPLREAIRRLESRKLLERGAEVGTADADGDTPLHHASNGGHADLVRLLLEAGAAVDAENEAGRCPPDVAANEEVTAAFG